MNNFVAFRVNVLPGQSRIIARLVTFANSFVYEQRVDYPIRLALPIGCGEPWVINKVEDIPLVDAKRGDTYLVQYIEETNGH
jgi:hypothetical protein